MNADPLEPYRPPAAADNPSPSSPLSVPSAMVEVARWQKNLMFLMVVRFLANICLVAMVAPHRPWLPWLVYLLLGGLLCAFFTFRLASALGKTRPLVYAIGAFLPLLWLIILLRLSGTASRQLRANGIAVGWLGAQRDSLLFVGAVPPASGRPAAALAVPVFVLAMALVSIVPKFEQIFRELGITLPFPSEMLITFSRHQEIAIALVMLWPIAHLLVGQSTLDVHARSLWRHAMWIAVVASTLFIILGCFLPLIKIIDELRK